MIVNDCYAARTVGGPLKTNAVLCIDGDTVLSGAVSDESFEAVARRNTKLVSSHNRVELVKLARRDAPQVPRTRRARCLGPSTVEDVLRARICGCSNHDIMMAGRSCYRKAGNDCM